MIKKKAFFIAGSCIGLVLAVSATVCYLQYRTNGSLKSQLAEKKELLTAAQAASFRLKELQAQSDELRKKETQLESRVPAEEKYPLVLLKELSAVAAQTGLGRVKFVVKEGSALGQPLVALLPAFRAHYFSMKCAGSYRQLMVFLARVRALDRITTVEKAVLLRREKEPNIQVFSLDLAAYVFPKQQLPAAATP